MEQENISVSILFKNSTRSKKLNGYYSGLVPNITTSKLGKKVENNTEVLTIYFRNNIDNLW